MVAGFPSWLGRLLRGRRAGMHKTVFNDVTLADVPSAIMVESPAFVEGGAIPRVHTGDGDKTSPPLTWRGVPAAARSLVLLVEDADSPTASPFLHLVAWGLPPRDGSLAADVRDGLASGSAESGGVVRLGRNGLLGRGYTPPDPPPGHGSHRYAFQLFALDRVLDVRSAPGRSRLKQELRSGVLAKGQLLGTYERP